MSRYIGVLLLNRFTTSSQGMTSSMADTAESLGGEMCISKHILCSL